MSYSIELPVQVDGGTCVNPHAITASSTVFDGSSPGSGETIATHFTNLNQYVDFSIPQGEAHAAADAILGADSQWNSGEFDHMCLVAMIRPIAEHTTGIKAGTPKNNRFHMEWSLNNGVSFVDWNFNSSTDTGTSGTNWNEFETFTNPSGDANSYWEYGDSNPMFSNANPFVKNENAGNTFPYTSEYMNEFDDGMYQTRGLLGSMILGHAFDGDFSNSDYIHGGTPPGYLRSAYPPRGNNVSLNMKNLSSLKMRLKIHDHDTTTAFRNLRVKVQVSYVPHVMGGAFTDTFNYDGTGVTVVYAPVDLDSATYGIRMGATVISHDGTNIPAHRVGHRGSNIVPHLNFPTLAGYGKTNKLTFDDTTSGGINPTQALKYPASWGEHQEWTGGFRNGQHQISMKEAEWEFHHTRPIDIITGGQVGGIGTNPGVYGETGVRTNQEGGNNHNLGTTEIKLSDFDGGGSTVLCTEMYKQGKLDKNAYKRDKQMTDTWMAKRPLLKAGYLCFAHWPLWMLRNKKEFAEKYMHHVIRDFSYFYADRHPSTKKKYKKNNWVGKSMMIFGLLFFPPLGLLTKISKNKKYRLILSTATTAFWFLPLLVYSIFIIGINKFMRRK